MNIEEYTEQLKNMTDAEIGVLIQDIRRSRNTSMNSSRIKAVKKKTRETNVKSAITGFSSEEKEELKKLLAGMKEEK